jgi:hypothetical protein
VKDNTSNDLWTMHDYKEIRRPSSEEFIGYVAMTGVHVLIEGNVEESNYF